MLLPIPKKVTPKTITIDNLFATSEEIQSVKNRIKEKNRNSKINSILYNEPFIEDKLEYDQEYILLINKGVTPISGPTNCIFYLDFKYNI